jgi:hypothetical protein
MAEISGSYLSAAGKELFHYNKRSMMEGNVFLVNFAAACDGGLGGL